MPEESVVSPAAVAPPSARLVRLVRWSCEILLMTAIFAAAGAWPTPDTNEAHYLARARHSWDPSWGAGDFFLDSPEAHGVFYRLLGPLAAALPLEQAAWLGRQAGQQRIGDAEMGGPIRPHPIRQPAKLGRP